MGALSSRKIKLFGNMPQMIPPFQPEKLPYAYDALEPFIDAKTMELHYSKHYFAYTENLNKAISGTAYEGKDIAYIIEHLKADEHAVRNNGGGYLNHSFFWQCLSPSKSVPSNVLKQQINAAFGSVDNFKAAFSEAVLKVFGSGWAWLAKDGNNKLFITTTPNQDSLLMSFADKKGAPLLGLDVWEHAYYLKYNNLRADYIKAFWNVVNWDFVNKNYA